MKRLIILLFSSASLFAQQQTQPIPAKLPSAGSDNLPVMDIYGIVPRDLNGGGAGLGIFSQALPLPGILFGGAADLRLGGDIFISSLDRKRLHNVPLQEPQTGEAKVKLRETLFGLNAVARLSMPWDEKFTPYVDGFCGIRGVSTGITVIPENYQPGYEKSTSDNLDAVLMLNYGATAGFLVALGPNVKLNAGVMFSCSHKPGTIDNIHSVTFEGNGLVMQEKILPQNMVLFKLGLTFTIDPSEGGNNCCNCGSSRSSTGRSTTVFSKRPSSPNKVGTRTRVMK